MSSNLKHFTLAIALAAFALLISSCDSSNNSVEYWKPTVFEKFGHYKDHDVIDAYLDKRFNSMVSAPNEFQSAYLEIAKRFCKYDLDLRGGQNIPEEVNKYVMGLTQNQYLGRSGEEFANNENVMANMRSHPELYAENIIKIIGSLDDLREALAEHVKVEKVISEEVSGFKRHNVLYNIAGEEYAICCITETGDNQSEIQFVHNSKSISDVLDYWQAVIE